MFRLLIGKRDGPEVKHVPHGKGVAGEGIDHQLSQAVKGFAVPAFHIEAGSRAGIREAVMFAAGKIQPGEGDSPAEVHHFLQMEEFTELRLKVVPVSASSVL